MNIEELLQLPQYSLPQAEKERVLLQSLEELSRHHRERSPEYNRLVSIMFPDERRASLADLPYLPVGLFKEHPLASIRNRKFSKRCNRAVRQGSSRAAFS